MDDGMARPISFRYIVNDVDAAIEFYTKMLGFKVDLRPASEFAIMSQGDFRLFLTKPGGRGAGGQSMADGTEQSPGGWNRLSIAVEDLDSMIEKLKKAGCRFRSDTSTGPGGKSIILIDPSDNLVELFEYSPQWKPK
jgi:predicted enzyme related to lactoylglutathione lyase